MTLEELRKHKPEIMRIAKGYGITNIRVFGSVARGEANEESDLDLLVTLPNHLSFFDYAEAEMNLQDALGVPVQMLSERAVHDLLHHRIFSEAVVL